MEIVAVDGEAIERGGGRQDYILLRAASSTGQAWELLSDRGGALSSQQIFEWLWAVHQQVGKAQWVIYGGTYDFEHWLRGLRPPALRQLDQGLPVVWREWLIRYRRGSHLDLEPLSDSGTRLRVIDVSSYFRRPFLAAVSTWLGPDAAAASVAAGKARRGKFGRDDIGFLSEYCGLEVVLLARLWRAVREFVAAEAVIPEPTTWSGPGSLAGALLRRHVGIKALGEVPEHLERIWAHAYYGGRSELWRVGTYGRPVWTLDLRSAYASAARELPDLRAPGKWLLVTDPTPADLGRFGVWWVDFDAPDGLLAYPLPQRTVYGQVFFPRRVSNWWWAPDVRAALEWARHCARNSVTVVQGWVWVPEGPARPEPGLGPGPGPFGSGWVEAIYERRRQLAAAGHPGAELLRDALAALYGKLCQRRRPGERWAPRWHQRAWAGWITARVRERLWGAVWAVGLQHVIELATDGLTVTAPPPVSLGLGDGLGEWRATGWRHGGVWVQPGLRWLRGEVPERPEARTRGFRPGVLTLEAVREAWARGDEEFEVGIERFVSLREALVAGDLASWRRWRCDTVQIDLLGRSSRRAPLRGAVSQPGCRLEPLEPRWVEDWVDSAAYDCVPPPEDDENAQLD